MSDKSIMSPTISNNSLAPSLDYIGSETRAKSYERCLKQVKITFTNKKL